MFKVCQKCSEKNPPRCRRCKKCDSPFAFKVKKKDSKKIKINWRELQKGDVIKVAGGGPFFKKKDSAEELSMGYSGIFTVHSIDENGIQAFGNDKFSGYCHIWMNGEKESYIGISKRPHYVFKIEKKQ